MVQQLSTQLGLSHNSTTLVYRWKWLAITSFDSVQQLINKSSFFQVLSRRIFEIRYVDFNCITSYTIKCKLLYLLMYTCCKT